MILLFQLILIYNYYLQDDTETRQGEWAPWIIIIRELKQARFWYANGNRKWAIFTVNLL